jgi:hypothetical protein
MIRAAFNNDTNGIIEVVNIFMEINFKVQGV